MEEYSIDLKGRSWSEKIVYRSQMRGSRRIAGVLWELGEKKKSQPGFEKRGKIWGPSVLCCSPIATSLGHKLLALDLSFFLCDIMLELAEFALFCLGYTVHRGFFLG